MMKQLAPAFALARFKTNLKALAHDAQKAGYVTLTDNPGSDFTVVATSSSVAPATPVPEPTKREYDFSTAATIAVSYRTILQEHRVPLLPWRIRYKFLRLLWEEFDNRGEFGMSLDTMRSTLLDYANSEDLHVSQQMIQKLLYTLNFARCFNFLENAAEGYQITIPQDLHSPLYPVVDAEEATNKLHRRYLQLLASEAALLDPNSVFDLLYGGDVTDDQETEERRAVLAKFCDQLKPMGQMGQAILAASRRTNAP